MADTTTKKILIEVEAKYSQITRAISEMSNLAVQIDALKTLRKNEQVENGKTSQAYISLDTQLKSTQKEYNTLSRFIVAANVSAKAMESTLAEGGSFILSQEAQLGKLTMAWKGMTAEMRATAVGINLKAQIDATTKSLFENGTQLDRNKITVGDYANQIEGLIVKMGKEGQAVSATSQAYVALLAKYQMAEAETRQLILTKGADDAASIESIAKMKKYGMELDKLNSTMGKYQAKTVNAQYATFSLSQVVREMPNFAIDARLGFMALSNNLPMLAQDFQTLKVQLGSTGKAFKAFAASLFGINTIMVILSTVLIAWGPQIMAWIGGIFGAKKGLDAFGMSLRERKEEFKAYNDTMAQGRKNAVQEITNLKLLYQASQNLNLPMKDRLAAVDEMQSKYPSYFGNLTQEQILTGNAAKEYDNLSKSILAAGKARAMQDKIVTNETKIIDLQERAAENQRQIVAKQADVAEYNRKLNEGEVEGGLNAALTLRGLKDRLKEFEAVAKDYESQIKSLTNTNARLASGVKIPDLIAPPSKDLKNKPKEETPAQRLKRQADEAIALAQKKNEDDEAKIKAEEGYQSLDFTIKQEYEKRLFDLKQKFELEKFQILVDNHQKTLTEQKAFQATLANDEATFDKNQAAAATKDAAKKAKDAEKAAADAKKKLMQMLGQNEQIEMQETKDAFDQAFKDYETALGDKSKLTIDQLFELKAYELLVEEEKQKALAEIRDKYRKQEVAVDRATILQNYAQEIKAADLSAKQKYTADKGRIQSEIDLLDKQYGEKAKMSEKDAEKYNKLLKERTANELNYQESKKKAFDDYSKAVTDTASAFNELLSNLEQSQLQEAQDKHDEQVKSLDDKLSKGLISQKQYDKEVAISAEALDKKKRKIAHDEAVRAKILSIMSIIVNTASAIMGALLPPPSGLGPVLGIPFAVGLGARGAVQLAAASAAPVPKAAKGMLLHGPSHAGGGIPIEAEGGEAIINRKSTSMFKPLLSAINAAGGGVRFAAGGMPVGLANDGGFSARQAFPIQMGPTAEQIAEAVAKLNISVSVEQIEKAQTKFVSVRGRASF